MTEETKFCKDCLHFEEGEYVYWCHHPALGISTTASKLKPRPVGVIRFHHLCGECAELFESKSVAKSRFHAIIAYMFNSKE